MRGGELLGLTWDDVDFRKREISVNKTLVYIKDKETKKYVFKYQTPKTKNSIRTIPMQDSVYKALKRQWIQLKEMQLSASEWQPLEGFENLVFVGKNGKPITEHTFQVTKKAGREKQDSVYTDSAFLSTCTSSYFCNALF